MSILIATARTALAVAALTALIGAAAPAPASAQTRAVDGRMQVAAITVAPDRRYDLSDVENAASSRSCARIMRQQINWPWHSRDKTECSHGANRSGRAIAPDRGQRRRR